MKNLFKYFISIICSFSLIASGCFCVSASDLPDDVDDYPLNIFDVAYIEILISDEYGNDITRNVVQTELNSLTWRYTVHCTEWFDNSSQYYCEIGFNVSDERYYTSDFFCLGSYNILLRRYNTTEILSINDTLTYRTDLSQTGNVKGLPSSVEQFVSSEGYPCITTSYKKQDLNTKYNRYINGFYFSTNYSSNDSTFLLYLSAVDFSLVDPTSYNISSSIDENTDRIISNQNENTDKILDAGENVDQPDFDSTNSSLDSTTQSINDLESQYQLDQTSTQDALNQGVEFLSGSQMQKASIQVKNWIERFSSENRVISGFLVSVMVLGLCFWIIGRKAW